MLITLYALVAVITVINVVLAVRSLRISHFRSLLAWHCLIFFTFLPPGIIAVLALGQSDDFIISGTNATVVKCLLSTIIIGLIGFAYLAFLSRLYPSHRLRVPDTFGRQRFSARHLGTFLLILAGLAMYLRTEKASFAIGNAWEAFTSIDYGSYYTLRAEHLAVDQSNLELYAEQLSLWIVLPLFNLYCLAAWIRGMGRVWMTFYILSLPIWIMSTVLSLQKYPLWSLVISTTAVIFVLHRQQIKLRLFKISLSLAAIVAVLFGSYYVTGESRPFWDAGLDRAFLVPARTTYAQFLIYPDHHEHLYFNGSRTLNTFLGFGNETHLSTDYDTVAVIGAYLAEGGVYSLNTSILGDGWANFGFIGVAQCGIVLFGVFFLWDLYLERRMNGHSLVPLVGFFVGAFATILNADLMYLLTKESVLASPAIYLFLVGARYRRRLRAGGGGRDASLVTWKTSHRVAVPAEYGKVFS